MAKRPIKTVKEATDLPRCECGCGVIVKSKFAQGHDSKLKSSLLRAFNGGEAEAGDELVKRGWYTANELQQRRDKARVKAAKKAAKTEAEPVAVESEPEAEQPRVARGRKRRSDRAPMAHIGNAAS